ncbi:MAG TPA: competence protein ComK [Savagea sp.]
MNSLHIQTMALLPTTEGPNRTKILLPHEQFFSTLTPRKLLLRSFKLLNRPYAAHEAFARKKWTAHQKLPLIIEIGRDVPLVLFPTLSPHHPDNAWLSFFHIEHIKKRDAKTTELTFVDGQRATVACSEYTLNVQLSRTLLTWNSYTTESLRIDA